MRVTLPDGEEAEFEEIEFDPVKEEWNEYELDDGSTVRLKTVVKRVLRAEDQYNRTGEPLYNVESQNIVQVSNVPEELHRDDDSESDGE